jgi:integrase
MANELQPLPIAAVGDVIDPAGLAGRAAEVAARQRSPETRRTYAAVYRSFGAFLGSHAASEDLTAEAVRYRDRLECAGRSRPRSPSTCPRCAASPRRSASAVSCARYAPRGSGAGSHAPCLTTNGRGCCEVPDRRSRQGERDLAPLHLLGSAGLRRAEAANLLVSDIDERCRAGDPRLRQAIRGSTSWWVSVRYGKRGRNRIIPLGEDALEALVAWVKSRPTAPTEHLLLALPAPASPDA